MAKKSKKSKSPEVAADFTDAEWAEHVARMHRWFPDSKLTLGSDRRVANYLRCNPGPKERVDVLGGIEVPADIRAHLAFAEREARQAGGSILDVDVNQLIVGVFGLELADQLAAAGVTIPELAEAALRVLSIRVKRRRKSEAA